MIDRYSETPIVEESGIKFYGFWKRLPISIVDVNIITITSEYAGRWDLLAREYLGDMSLWWVIADLNNLQDPLYELREGENIIVPVLTTSRKTLEKKP